MDGVQKFTESAAYSVLIQISFRASTFLLNAVLLRFVSRELLGIVNVRLMLLYTTLTFLGGEPFRRACLSRVEDPDYNWRKALNLTWFCPLITFLLSVPLTLVWTQLLTLPDESEAQHYSGAVLMFALSVIIEKLAEPLFILGQTLMLVKLKAVIEASYYGVRQLLFALLTIFYPQNSLLNFGWSMIITSILYTSMYYGYFFVMLNRKQFRQFEHLRKIRDIFPHFAFGIDSETLRLTYAFWRHSFVKQMLTEGERYVMTVFNILNFADQGLYDVITNLGSLVARIIFAPLEESGYVYFSVSIERGASLKEQNQENLLTATRVFKALLKLVSLIGCIILVFGFSYSFVALNIYGGTLLSSGRGPLLLKWFSMYVVLLAINGITECFTFAVMTESQVDRHHKWLVAFCLCFLITALWLTKLLGSVGFILANCINMLCRIVYSSLYIGRFFSMDSASLKDLHRPLSDELSRSPLFSAFPNSAVLLSLIVSGLITSISNIIFCCDGAFNTLAHIAVGCICLLATLLRVYNTELEFVDFVMKYILKCKVG